MEDRKKPTFTVTLNRCYVATRSDLSFRLNPIMKAEVIKKTSIPPDYGFPPPLWEIGMK